MKKAIYKARRDHPRLCKPPRGRIALLYNRIYNRIDVDLD